MNWQDFRLGAVRGIASLRVRVAFALALAGVTVASTATAVAAPPKLAGSEAAKLTAGEQRALQIASVNAAGDESLGLVVTVTFRGDVERYRGRGDLNDGLLVLSMTPIAAPTTATGVVDVGGGFVPFSFPVLRRAGVGVSVGRGTAEAFGAERVLSNIKPGNVSVILEGDRVIFYLGAIGLSRPTKISVEAMTRSPSAGLRPDGARTLTTSAWHAILSAKPTAAASVTIDPTQLTVAQLGALRAKVSAVRSRGLEPEIRQQQRARAQLTDDLVHYRSTLDLLHVSSGLLVADSRAAATAVTRLQREATAARELLARLNSAIAATSVPPVGVVQTDAGLAELMAHEPGLVESRVQPQRVPIIDVNEHVRYQQFTGIGAALTDSSAWLIGDALPEADSDALLQALFGNPAVANALGVPAIHLNFLRVAIGASGAMTLGAPYSYDDTPSGNADPSLAHFSIAHDVAYIIPTLQQALAINPGLEILANPWSAPAWMKSNDSLDNIDALGTLLPSADASLAQYFVKFIRAYESYGIPIAAITPQNEPSSGTVSTAYPGLTLPEPDEAQLVARYLAPALQAAGLATKIYGNDLSWDSLAYAASLASGLPAEDLAGISWHCYYGSPDVMSELHDQDPGLDQIVDECSPEIRPLSTPEFLISSLRNWGSAVAVWTLALDPSGGPIQPGNDCVGCTGPITINEQTDAITIRPEYYQLGQVSAFVQPGAWRIASQSFVSYGVSDSNFATATTGLDDVAFLNPDGTRTLVAFNHSSSPITFGVDTDGRYFVYTLPARAMTTFVWR